MDALADVGDERSFQTCALFKGSTLELRQAWLDGCGSGFDDGESGGRRVDGMVTGRLERRGSACSRCSPTRWSQAVKRGLGIPLTAYRGRALSEHNGRAATLLREQCDW